MEENFGEALTALEEIENSKTVEEAFDCFLKYTRNIGATDIMVGQIAGLNDEFESFDGLLLLSDPKMMDRWKETETFLNDPVINLALRRHTPFLWQQAFNEPLRNAPSCDEYLEIFQTDTALEIPVHSPFKPAGGVSVLLEKDAVAAIDTNMVHLASLHLFSRFESLMGHTANQLRHELTERELNILTLVAIGKTDLEIAEKYIISVNTVRFHLKSIMRKLGALNRTHAVSIGIQIGVIIP